MTATAIAGFTLFKDYIDQMQEVLLLKKIDDQPWIVDYARRLQYYGYRNELEKPYALVEFPVPMPDLLRQLAQRIHDEGILQNMPDQVIINEYVPGEGIKPHKDRNYFENQICGVNLGSDCIMRFIGPDYEVNDILIPRRSVYLMQDDARYKFSHGIAPRKKDVVDGVATLRERRVSITYRKVIAKKVKPIDPNGRVAGILAEQFGVTSV
ncbi:alpha-ketoglutarate-dependent dioxygenase AlkB [Mucilaginibacter sp. 21P]|uniref:alpha-ketoglutarate-dependent dioxygenase AlkB n=1 Tax=Mucilaginibacter sp. 21P TaxID=2778902 RepID=UPI001C594DC3|nr:alpha-ketoglutarate-dependent dioxygenase AlkB [Mucilaginibacter sp. 21P]QXV63701.1 alpha-ketoglutarate-dependent dioxygenase AlkB [Mucilaginibacter sp. 21P]